MTLVQTYALLLYRSIKYVSEHAQVVPGSSVTQAQHDDCTVPDQEGSISRRLSVDPTLPPPTPSNIDLNAVHLTLSPVLVTESLLQENGVPSRRSGIATLMHMPAVNPHSSAPMHVAPSSPTGLTGPFVPFVLTDFPPSTAHRPPASNSTSSQNPFSQQSSPSQSIVLSTSPSNSLNVTQLTNGFGNRSDSLPNSIHTSRQGGSSYSFPPPSFASHRYPRISVSGDPLISTSLQETVEQGSNGVPTNSQPLMMFGFGGPSSSPSPGFESRVIVSGQNVMDSLVTIRPTRHSYSGVTMESVSGSSNRHSFSGEHVSSQLIIPASMHSQAQRRRRNSSGSEQRRHSHHSFSGVHTGSRDTSRHRRRSYDTRDNCHDLAEGQRSVARRSSRTQSTPFSVPIRIQLTPSTVPTTTAESNVL